MHNLEKVLPQSLKYSLKIPTFLSETVKIYIFFKETKETVFPGKQPGTVCHFGKLLL